MSYLYYFDIMSKIIMVNVLVNYCWFVLELFEIIICIYLYQMVRETKYNNTALCTFQSLIVRTSLLHYYLLTYTGGTVEHRLHHHQDQWILLIKFIIFSLPVRRLSQILITVTNSKWSEKTCTVYRPCTYIHMTLLYINTCTLLYSQTIIGMRLMHSFWQWDLSLSISLHR